MFFSPAAALALLVFGLSLLKLAVLGHTGGRLEGEGGFTRPVMIAEARLYAYFLALYGLACLVAPFLAGLVKALIALIVVLCLVDLGLLWSLFARLSLVETFKLTFKSDGKYTLAVLREFVRHSGRWGTLYLAFAAAAGFILIRFMTSPETLDLQGGGLLLLAAVGLYLPKKLNDSQAKMFYTWVVENTVDFLFAESKKNKAYSPAFAADLLARYEEPGDRSLPGSGARPNVILIILESFSVYHSKYLAGIYNFMPNLDLLMRENVVFTNFYANGVTSEEGLIALLTGEVPLPAPQDKFQPQFSRFNRPADSLPHLFNRHHYETLFLTAADFDSFGVGRWAEQIGFNRVQARETLAYDDSKKAGFSTATDEVLYINAIQQLKQLPQPYFMVLETGTSHEPFVDPDTGRASEGLCFRYADRKLYEFIRYLEVQNFFDNGLVFIVGDHRRRRGLLKQEYERWGEAAKFKVPLVLIDGKKQGRTVEAAYQQADFLPSLRCLLEEGDVPLNPRQGVFLPTPQRSARYILIKNSLTFLDTVTVLHQDQTYRVILDGDKTRFEDKKVRRPDVIDDINYQRLKHHGRPAIKMVQRNG